MSLLKRKANWTSPEINILVEECITNYDALFRKFDCTTTSGSKDALWTDITEKVNSTGGYCRKVDEIIKKWKDLKSHTKKKEQQRRRNLCATGGGSQDEPLKSWEEMIINRLPRETLEGISGGNDTFKVTEKSQVDEVDNIETVLGGERIIHPSNINIEMETNTHTTIDKKSTKNELYHVQLKYFKEEAETSAHKREYYKKKGKLIDAQVEFFKAATEKLKTADMHDLMDILYEQ